VISRSGPETRARAEARQLTAIKVVAINSPLYKHTFFPTDRQTNLQQTGIITVIEAHAWEFYSSVFASQQILRI